MSIYQEMNDKLVPYGYLATSRNLLTYDRGLGIHRLATADEALDALTIIATGCVHEYESGECVNCGEPVPYDHYDNEHEYDH